MISTLRNTIAGAAAAFILFGTDASALTFNVAFDAIPDGTLAPPIVGGGTVSFDDPGNGTFEFFSLLDLDIALAIDGALFTEADIVTTTGTTGVITEVGAERFLQFGGNGDGPFGGSLDFVTAASSLTFSPEFLGLGLYQSGDPAPERFGDYLATTAVIPLPATLPLLLAAIGGLGFLPRGRSVADAA